MLILPLWAVELGPVKVNAINIVECAVLGALLVSGQNILRRRIAARRARHEAIRHADHTGHAGGWFFGDFVGASGVPRMPAGRAE
jgi:hypothetical protein